MITKRGIERLRKLSRFLKTLPPDKFDIAKWVSVSDIQKHERCGTVCCAWGWAPKLWPGLVKWRFDASGRADVVYSYYDGLLAAQKFFGISPSVAQLIFLASSYYNDFNVHPLDVAHRIDALLTLVEEKK